MADVTIFHNPHCSSSRNALAVAEAYGLEVDVVLYMKTPPDRATLERLAAIIEDPVENLVRKDANFRKLGLAADDDVGNPVAVVDLLERRKALMQRPVVVQGDRAIVGRPKHRVDRFLAE